MMGYPNEQTKGKVTLEKVVKIKKMVQVKKIV